MTETPERDHLTPIARAHLAQARAELAAARERATESAEHRQTETEETADA